MFIVPISAELLVGETVILLVLVSMVFAFVSHVSSGGAVAL